MLDFIKDNFAELVIGMLAFIKIVVNLTPSEKDNKVFGIIDMVINALFPNRKRGGGKHPNR